MSYSADSLEVLSGLEPVQKRPAMYTNTDCPNHLFQEVLDNSTDEFLAQFAKTITVTLYKDGSLSVEDDGRGMPTEKHSKEKISGVELILTRLHAGAKFSDKAYEYSGGLHGVGVSVVNALSKRLEVTVRRGGKQYEMAFEHGKKVSELKVTKKVGARNTGTQVRFWVEEKYFDTPTFQVKQLEHLLRAKAVLCSGLTIHFINEKTKDKTTWYYQSGLEDYLQTALKGQTLIPEAPILETQKTIEWALAFTPEQAPTVTESYVNLIPTAQGGTHVNGFRTGLFDALKEFAQVRSLVPKGLKITADDLWQHCTYVLSVKLKDPQFAGQTKERLSSRECAGIVSQVVKDHFSVWLHQHVLSGEALTRVVVETAEKRSRQKKTVTRKKVAQGPALPGKLSDCTQKEQGETEIFFVEGDSAGGSAKQARDRTFQAIMPLRGKILNTWEVGHNQVLSSQEIQDISTAIGVLPGATDLSTLRYQKICILADADSDGAHIATLLCALFVKHYPALVKAGHVYMAMPPLYRIDLGKEVFYALDDAEKNGLLKKLEKKKGTPNVQRFKGLGEMNPSQLRETTMSPDTRRLVQLTLPSEKQVFPLFDLLLSKKRSACRKQWLEKKGKESSVL